MYVLAQIDLETGSRATDSASMQDKMFWKVIQALVTILNMKTTYFGIILAAAREKFKIATGRSLLPVKYAITLNM